MMMNAGLLDPVRTSAAAYPLEGALILPAASCLDASISHEVDGTIASTVPSRPTCDQQLHCSARRMIAQAVDKRIAKPQEFSQDHWSTSQACRQFIIVAQHCSQGS